MSDQQATSITPDTGLSPNQKSSESTGTPGESSASSIFKEKERIKVLGDRDVYKYGWYYRYLDFKHSIVYYDRSPNKYLPGLYLYHSQTKIKNKMLSGTSLIDWCLYF